MADDGANPAAAEFRTQFVVSFTGLFGAERARAKRLVVSLGGVASGRLQLGETTHLVCAPEAPPAGEPSAKLQLALAGGVPLVGTRWLDHSAAAGRWLPALPYLLPRASSGSTTGPATAPPPASPGEASPELLRDAAAPEGGGGGGFVVEHLNPLFSEARRRAAAPADPLPAPLPPLLATPPARASGTPAPTGSRASSVDDALVDASESLSSVLAKLLMDDGSAEVEAEAPAESEAAGRLTPSADGAATELAGSPAAELSPSLAALRALPSAEVRLLGAPLPPSAVPRAALAALRAHHGAAAARGAVFFAAAEFAAPGGAGAPLALALAPAGAARAPPARGLEILYDLDAGTGRRTTARVLTRRLYALPALGGQAWLQHAYLLGPGRADFEEREGWAAAPGRRRWAGFAGGRAPAADELVLAAGRGLYWHSPAHLVVGEFALCWESAAGGAAEGAEVAEAAEPRRGAAPLPAFRCRQAFNVAARAPAPLEEALAHFAAA
jgi:hypothetical protein